MTGAVLRALPGTAGAARRPAFELSAAVVVVGHGAAGASAALEAATGGLDVLLVCKTGLDGGSTPWAQGGLAAAVGAGDTPALHARDTVVAGAGLNDTAAVDALVGAAPAEVARLRTLGARFDDGPLGLEGGHSRPRIVHAGGDASGAEVHRVLAAATVAAVATGRLRLLDHTVALDLVLDDAGRVAGVLVGRTCGAGLEAGLVRAADVVLASGGFGQAWATTSNPDGVTGDGLALAARAGAEIADVEFVQFHPTVLWRPGGRGRRPLVTEALRGAGAVIVDAAGLPVMAGAHPLGDLAPRDVVAATMQRRMAEGPGPSTHLWLDATGVGRERLAEEFPTVAAACRAAGTDPSTEPIPVAPGAHYACGGIRADMDGSTSLEGLHAVGEVASTGVHGANRLASNSVTEALTAGRRLGRRLVATGPRRPGAPAPGGTGASTDGTSGAGPTGMDPAARASLADAMSAHAGVVRHAEGLEHLLGLLDAAPAAGRLDLGTVEATNLHTVSTLVTVAALARTESRGCHRRSDFPLTSPDWQRRVGLRLVGGRVAVAAGATR